MVFGCLFFLLTAIAILSNVVKSKTVTSDTIYGAICAYLLMGLTWAFLFCTLEVLHPARCWKADSPSPRVMWRTRSLQ